MGKTSIEWTDRTWNAVSGCTKVSPGCDHCFAERMSKRLRGRFGYPQDEPFAVTLHPERLAEPFHWRKPRRIFVCSMSDLFHPRVPFEFIHRLFCTMAILPQHTFQLLTKRPGRMAYFANHYHPPLWGDRGTTWGTQWPPNVWAGTSVESAKYLPRLDLLAQVPAKVRFVSAEPLLGPLDLRPWLTCEHPVHFVDMPGTETPDDSACPDCQGRLQLLDWVIVGGESGPGARPMHPQWARDIRDQCQEAGVPFFFKQWGEWSPNDLCDPAEELMHRVGKKAAGALLDGRAWEEVPLL